MDEFLFHLGRTTEYLQLWLYELGSKASEAVQILEESIISAASSQRILSIKEAASETIQFCVVTASETAFKITNYADSSLNIAFFRQIDMNRATLYACCVGFTVGSGVGFALGFFLQSPRPTSFLMRAVTATSFNPDSITLLEDVFIPKITKPDQIMVEVKYASLDPVDILVSTGYGRRLRSILSRYNPNFYSELPLVLGRNGSGVVVEIGSGVKDIEIGSNVYFSTDILNCGTLAEYTLCDLTQISILPRNLNFESAASIASTAVLSYFSVVNKAGLCSKTGHSKNVFVHCATTGCGWMIVQLCASFGARVSASATNNAKISVRSLGASDVYTVESGELLKHKNRYDIVFNTVGPIAYEFCSDLCLHGGKVIETYPKKYKSDEFGFIMSSLYSLWIRITYGIFGFETWKEYDSSKILEEVGKLYERRLLQSFNESTFYPEEIENAVGNLENGFGSTLIRFDRTNLNSHIRKKAT